MSGFLSAFTIRTLRADLWRGSAALQYSHTGAGSEYADIVNYKQGRRGCQ